MSLYYCSALKSPTILKRSAYQLRAYFTFSASSSFTRTFLKHNMGAAPSKSEKAGDEDRQSVMNEKQLSHNFTALNLDENEARTRFAGLSHESLERYEEEFYAEPKNQFALNAITRNEITSVLINHKASVKDQHIFNVQTDVEGKATNQKSSGRCWLFAGKI
jgi:bleomycin hydrolase